MKKWKLSAVTLMIWPYLGFAVSWAAGRLELPSAFWLYVLLTAAVYIMNIVNACSCRGEGAAYRLSFWNMLIKLVHIPYHLFLFLLGILFLAAMVVPALIFVSPFLAVVLSVISWLLLVTSSAYGLNAIVRGKKEGKLPVGEAVCHAVLHLFFVTDVISAVLVFRKIRRREKAGRAEK